MSNTNHIKKTDFTGSNIKVLNLRNMILGLSEVDPETKRRLVRMPGKADLAFTKLAKKFSNAIEPLGDVEKRMNEERDAIKADKEKAQKAFDEAKAKTTKKADRAKLELDHEAKLAELNKGLDALKEEWMELLNEEITIKDCPMIKEALLATDADGPGAELFTAFYDFIEFEE